MGNRGLDQRRQGLEVSGNQEGRGWGRRMPLVYQSNMQDGGRGGDQLCRMRGQSLDCVDPSEARFSLQVNLDMEKIMEKLGGVST